MGKNNFYLITFILLSFFSFSVASAAEEEKVQVKAGFPFEGGMTSDSLLISDVKLENFEQSIDNETQKDFLAPSFDPKNKKKMRYSTMKFIIKVPDGKEAIFLYEVFLRMESKKAGVELKGSNVSFTVKVDDKKANPTHSDATELNFKTDVVTIPTGTHEVSVQACFSATNSIVEGRIDNLSVHIHHFEGFGIVSEPLCGETGKNSAKCDVCGVDSIIQVLPPFPEHDLVISTDYTSSCMANGGETKVCNNCPFSETTLFGVQDNHDFDDNDVCKVCKLHKPTFYDNGTRVDIYDAGEMRILAEMMSLGRVPTDIGVDIKGDLVFNKTITLLPLGNSDHPFQGVLNGNGHRISGITSAIRGVDCLAFVGVAKGTVMKHAVIANLIFDGGNYLKGEACVAGIVGYAENCDILNCASFGTLAGSNYVAGIVGYADKQVSIQNCASVCTIKTEGNWNTMVCGMPMGHIMNSYGAATNTKGGMLDILPTTTLRHCFSNMGSDEGLTQVSKGALSSYSMVQTLNEESETPCFMMSEKDHYPVPVVNSNIEAKSNNPVEASREYVALRAESSKWRSKRVVLRAASVTDNKDTSQGKKSETITQRGYVNKNAAPDEGKTMEVVMEEDANKYPDLNRLYIATNTVPDGFDLYDKISGGRLQDFEAYYIPVDSSYLKMTEYNVTSSGKLRAKAEMVNYSSGTNERIDEYTIENGSPTLKARLTFLNTSDIVYQEKVEGIMKPVWRIQTDYDDAGNATATNVLSYDKTTGAVRLEYFYEYDKGESVALEDEEEYSEYVDSLTNTIHVLCSYFDLEDQKTYYRDHYILRADDQYPLEVRTEKITDGKSTLVDGLYFLYDEDALVQSVSFGPVDDKDPDSELRPYMYYEYYGYWKGTQYPTSIKMPTANKPSLKKRSDPNVYDMQGRVVRRVTDTNDPFNGLPHGVYLYQGNKYLKRN